MKKILFYIFFLTSFFGFSQSTLQSIIAQSSGDSVIELFNSFYLNTEGDASEFKPIDAFYTHPVIFYNNHWYFTIMKTGGSTNNRGTRVYKVDAGLNIVQSYDIPNDVGITSSYDTHYKAVIAVDESTGHIYVCRERGEDSVGTSDGHNTDLLLYKTTTSEDISTLTLETTISGQFSYPILWVQNSTVYIGARGGTASANLDNWRINVSTDSGSTFNGYDVFETGLNTSGRAYVQMVYNYDDEDVIIAHNPRNDTLGAFEALYILRSSDGVVWENYQQTFSKDVDATVNLIQSELAANCLVWEKANDDYAINFEGGYVLNGQINILLSNSLISDVLVDGNVAQTYQELRLYTYDGGWTYKDVSELLPNNGSVVWARERYIQLISDGQFGYIVVLDKSGTTDVLKEYKSANSFQNYTENTIDVLGGNYFYGSYAYNATAKSEKLLIMYDVQGEQDDFNASSNLKLYTPQTSE